MMLDPDLSCVCIVLSWLEFVHSLSCTLTKLIGMRNQNILVIQLACNCL